MGISRRVEVDQERVLLLLSKGRSPYAVSRKLCIPTSVCNDIAKGKERPYYICRGALEDKSDVKLCERCRRREVPEGFEKLCMICWKKG